MAHQVRSTGGSATLAGIFACSGEYWTIGYGTTTFSLKDIRGLHYIQRLLQHPGEEFHALDLLSTGSAAESATADSAATLRDPSVSVGGLGDAGEMLDAQAKQNYRRRLAELREQLEQSRELGNHERTAKVESEIDFLTHEIARAVGLGGRDRRAGSAAERARLNVTRAIKAALQKIADLNLPLEELLVHSIRTGAFCRYAADPRQPVIWQFSLGNSHSDETKAASPLLSRRDSGFPRALAHRTAFVGREAERDMLSVFLEQALEGEGKVVMISGAPGVGKTRIADEVGAQASEMGFLALAGSCYDRDDSAPFIPFVEILEAALAHAPSPEKFREALGNDAPEIARLMPQLRRLFRELPPPLELSPEQSRSLLFNAVVEVLNRTAANRPVLLLLEDLHWANEGTLALLNHLARLVSKIPVIIVCTYRDNELELAGSLAKTLEELIRLHLVERIALGGLPQDAVAEMLRALSGREPPRAVVNLFYSDTEGNPFFVEELFRHLVEQGKLTDSAGQFRRDLKLDDIDVPQSLRLVIGRRLARLSDNTQKMLGTAAVIGRSFTFELLEAAIAMPEEQLLDSVEEAERVGLISSTVQYPESRFNFSHELIRQTVAGGLSAARRQRMHLKVVEAIERVYANALEDHANDLAHHLRQAGVAADSAKTIRYLSMAARRARIQGALTETGELYRDALEVLERIPETPERDQLELGLQLGIGAVLMATRGYAYAATAAAYQRATKLGERLGDPMQVVLALTGLAAQPLLRGELESAQALADQVLATSQHHGKRKTQVWGYYIQGVVHYHRGNLALAWERLSQAHALYREEEHQKNPQDPGSEAMEYIALTAWQLGMADTARARIREAISLNERTQKPYARAHCNFYAAYLHTLLRDPATTETFSDRVIKLSTERSIPLYADTGRILYGWAIAQQGRYGEGVACARSGLESFKAAGNRLGIGSFLGFLAEALLCAGALDEAMATVEEGLEAAPDQPGDLLHLLWLRGTLLMEKASREGMPPIQASEQSRTGETAENSFRKAISLADRVGSKSYALRATTSLGKLLALRGDASAARELIEPRFKSVVEGFDTRDLMDAKDLMEKLN